MQFKLPIVAALFATTAIAAPVPADSEPSCVQTAVSAINSVANEFSDLNASLSKQTNLADLVSAIVNGVKDNLTGLAKGTNLPCSGTVSQQDQKDLCAAANTLIKNEDTLVNTLTTKSSLLKNYDLSGVADVAKLLESDTEKYLQPIISESPVCGGEIEDSVKALESDINALIAAL